MPPVSSPRPPRFSREFSRWLGASARALVPVGGPVLANHLRNFAAQTATFPAFPALDDSDTIFILSPHPDDEVLGCAGLVQHAKTVGARVEIAFLTNGDGSRTTQIVLNAKSPNRRQSLFQIAQNRQFEALEAARRLGVCPENVHFLGFPDGACWPLMQHQSGALTPSPTTGFDRVPYERAAQNAAPYSRDSLVQTLAQLLEKTAPTQLFTTHPLDTHLDHKAAFAALEAAKSRAQIAARLWVFLIHYGIWPVPNGHKPDLNLWPPHQFLDGQTQWFSLELTQAQIAAKKHALEAHATQLASTPRYLHAFVRRNELFGIWNG